MGISCVKHDSSLPNRFNVAYIPVEKIDERICVKLFFAVTYGFLVHVSVGHGQVMLQLAKIYRN